MTHKSHLLWVISPRCWVTRNKRNNALGAGYQLKIVTNGVGIMNLLFKIKRT